MVLELLIPYIHAIQYFKNAICAYKHLLDWTSYIQKIFKTALAAGINCPHNFNACKLCQHKNEINQNLIYMVAAVAFSINVIIYMHKLCIP